MSFKNSNIFTKENLDLYLKELAKEFRKRNGTSIPAEIVLIGGAAILANYGFRNMTADVDAIIMASSAMKEAINCVGDKYNLPNGWLNSDFTKTGSYSPKLIEFSTYYKKFSNILTVRTVSAEYLIAMKLRSGRKYKNDLSDIIGILAEHIKKNKPIDFVCIDKAVNDLYKGWDDIPPDSKTFIEDALRTENYEQIYKTVNETENRSKELLVGFEEDYPGITNESNVNDILKNLKKRNSMKTPNTK